MISHNEAHGPAANRAFFYTSFCSFVAPTLLDFGSDAQAFHSAATMQEEIFGPLLPMLRVTGADEVLASINSRYSRAGTLLDPI
jgi:acyl-CoA reductase-like NAD-dependent aldehyde dehydrogenase